MEKFMLIFHGGIKQDASPEELQANMGKCMSWVESLNKEGKYVSGEPLLPGGKLVSSTNSIAVSYAVSKQTALDQLLQIKGLEKYYLYYTAIGEVYFEWGHKKEACSYYQKAFAFTSSL